MPLLKVSLEQVALEVVGPLRIGVRAVIVGARAGREPSRAGIGVESICVARHAGGCRDAGPAARVGRQQKGYKTTHVETTVP